MPKESPDDIVQVNLRMPRGVLASLDAWIDDLNRERRLGKATRNAVVLALIERGIEERPDLEAPPPKGKVKR